MYWICTVVTTVGYGDYTGSTSIEYIVTFGLEFFGLVVFSLLQVAVNILVSYDVSYQNFCAENDIALINWLKELEVSGYPLNMPKDLLHEIKKSLELSQMADFNKIV